MINHNLIFDLGMSEGNDTAYYLAKGFSVVGVEADPVICVALRNRFAHEIAAGRLDLFNAAAFHTAGMTVDLWRNDAAQGTSSLRKSNKAQYADSQRSFSVETVDWPTLVAKHGVPRYCKIDIEGGEIDFLKSVLGAEALPPYMSAESKTLEPIVALHELGYRHFKLVDQGAVRSFPICNPPLEGTYVPKPDWRHTSGPFGRELPGPAWLSFNEIKDLFQTLLEIKRHRTVGWTWYDCHAAIELD
jgi:FkbM family methyltransferase